MRATDIIRQILDIIDDVETQTSNIEVKVDNDDDGHFKQILSMLTNKQSSYTTQPNEVVAPVSAVTTDAGGGVNGPKHPDDIRVKDPRGY